MAASILFSPSKRGRQRIVGVGSSDARLSAQRKASRVPSPGTGDVGGRLYFVAGVAGEGFVTSETVFMGRCLRQGRNR